jgi:hypothetical protein
MAKKDPYMKDPYMIDTDEQKKTKDEAKMSSQGIFCPKRNKSIGGKCAVCEQVSVLFNTGDPTDKEVAYQKMAKANWYFNVIFPSEPDKVVLLEMGKKAGDAILDGVIDKGWTDIAHPKANFGREMLITKKNNGNFNYYEVSPNLQNADWDVPKEVLGNIPNLDDIIPTLKENPDNLYKVSSLKQGETLRFRILPPWDNGAGNKRIAAITFRHWGGVTQEEVDGIVAMDTSLPDSNKDTDKATEEKPPWEEDSKATEKPENKEAEKPKKEDDVNEGSSSKPDEPCLGNADLFDPDDEDCKKCWQFKKCGRLVAKKAA